MLQVRKDLCIGCGLCAQNCPKGAIYIAWGQAEIDHNRCNSCGFCIDICPQGAIAEKLIIAPQALNEDIANLRKETETILTRLDALIQVDIKNQGNKRGVNS